MQNQTPEDVIDKRPFMRHRTLLLPAFHRRKSRILPLGTGLTVYPLQLATRLHAQTSRKHELANRGTEPAQESIEGVVSSQYAIEELHSADKQQKHHEGVKHHGALRRCGEVLLPYMVGDLVYRGIRG